MTVPGASQLLTYDLMHSAVQPEYMANTFKLTTPDQVVMLQCDRAHQLPEWTDDFARCIMILQGLPLKFEAKQVILGA